MGSGTVCCVRRIAPTSPLTSYCPAALLPR
jgi:hypothetical protein